MTPSGRSLLDDVEHVLERQRLEVEPVGRVVVGGDRLRVAVDHDRFHAELAQRERGVDAAVVELDPLADAVGARAQDDDLAARRRRRLVLLLVGRVEVGRVGDELGGARVHRLEGGADARARGGARGRPASVAPVSSAMRRSAKPSCLARAEHVGVGEAASRDLALEGDDLAHVLEEPRVDLRERVDLRRSTCRPGRRRRWRTSGPGLGTLSRRRSSSSPAAAERERPSGPARASGSPSAAPP